MMTLPGLLKLFRAPYYRSIPFSLAACFLYAARHGRCKAQDMETDEWRELAARVRERYGDRVDSATIISEVQK